ncbi:hypothetical protein C4J81_17015 [Deltaproteobacteria bacterium Smac51]|nr:hypothetical protein C4J81_17015 [Deltaproteobacteria bacterium Smac51]
MVSGNRSGATMTTRNNQCPVRRPVSQDVLSLFQGAERVLVLTHQNPDGDALGSASGLALALCGQGKTAHIYLTGNRSDNLLFLVENLTVLEAVEEPEQYDLVALLDCHGFDRLGPDEGPALAALLAGTKKTAPLAVIDHHLLGDRETASSTWLWDSSASSTGELVTDLLSALEWSYSKEAADALLLAIASDTGFFSQTNATSGALAAASDLVAAGGSLEEVDRRIRKDWPPRRLRLMGLVLNSLELHFNGRVAIMSVTPAMLEAAQAEMSDTEDFVEMGRSLAGVDLSVLIKDSGGGQGAVRVGLRSRGEVNAQALAKSFGGGGHRQASAYNDPCAADAREVKTRLLAVVEKYL